MAKKAKVHCPVVWICEYHHDVLAHIHEAIRKRHLPFSNMKLLHLDSHPDLMFPLDLTADVCLQKGSLYDNISIADWILPLIYENHITSVIWIKPPWATQIDCGSYSIDVGKETKTEKLRVSCLENYFIEELLYSSEHDMEPKFKAVLDVFEMPLEHSNSEKGVCSRGVVDLDRTGKTGLPLKESSDVHEDHVVDISCSKQISFTSDVNKHISMDDVYILDIDLDFFSTQNPFRIMFEEDDLTELDSMFHFSRPLDGSIKARLECLENRKSQMDTLEKCYQYFIHLHTKEDRIQCKRNCLEEFLKGDKNQALAERYITFLQSYYNRDTSEERDVDLEMLHYAGLCGSLPHHVSSQTEVDALLDQTKRLLLTLPKPSIITIARSSTDDYTPVEQVEMIQEKLLSLLEEVYEGLAVNKDY